jgi:hypothetical protein
VGYPHVQGLYPYCNKWNENSLLYFISCFRKSASGLFNYGNKFTRVIASKMNVRLPVTKNDDIDYDFMENFISAQKKFIAKKLICWLEQQNINDNILKITTKKTGVKEAFKMADEIKVGVKPEFTFTCEKCGGTVTVPLSFQTGLRGLFVISDITDELL